MIIVTGGAGFIGSNFIHHWLANASGSVVNLDKLTYAGNLQSLADVADDPRYRFVQADIGDQAFMERLHAADLPTVPKILIGVGPFKHLRMAIHMRDKVWGVEVPEELIARMESASDEGEEGKKICIEVIQHLRGIDGIAGCHVMAVAWEESVPEILERAGISPASR